MIENLLKVVIFGDNRSLFGLQFFEIVISGIFLLKFAGILQIIKIILNYFQRRRNRFCQTVTVFWSMQYSPTESREWKCVQILFSVSFQLRNWKIEKLREWAVCFQFFNSWRETIIGTNAEIWLTELNFRTLTLTSPPPPLIQEPSLLLP